LKKKKTKQIFLLKYINELARALAAAV
jgi:hypothetical protein